MKNILRITLYIFSILLFSSNYLLCEYFYSQNIDRWWDLKMNINALVMALVFISSNIDKKGILRFVLDIGVGFTVSNVVDRLYFNTTQFTKTDIIMIIATFLFAIIDYKKDELTTNDKGDTP